MAENQAEELGHAWDRFLSRSTIKRCVLAALLTLPGALSSKGGTSIDVTLANAVLGCVVILLISAPLALQVSNPCTRGAATPEGRPSGWKPGGAISFIASVGVVVSIIQGTVVVPASYLQVLVAVPLAALATMLARWATRGTIPAFIRSWIDAIVIASGVFYGAIASLNRVSTCLLIIGFSIGSAVLARGMAADRERRARLFGRTSPAWMIALGASVLASFIAFLAAPEQMPMAIPTVTSWALSITASFMPSSSRMTLKALITSALVCLVLAAFSIAT